jgi:hypothetical protein
MLVVVLLSFSTATTAGLSGEADELRQTGLAPASANP